MSDNPAGPPARNVPRRQTASEQLGKMIAPEPRRLLPRRPTMADVAREAGVSVKTVSRIVNNESTVNPEYVDRVRVAIATLGFRRNNLARDLRRNHDTSTIGLVIEDVGNPFYSLVARGIERVARLYSTLVLTGSSEEDPKSERELVVELCQRRVDGLIIVPTDMDHSFCQAEIDMGTPMVFIDRRPQGIRVDTILLDNRGGAQAATERLLAKGHQRIGVIGHDLSIFTMRERLAGFKRAVRRAKYPLDPSLLCFGARIPEEAAITAKVLLDSDDPPTAFFCCNNRMTIGVVSELMRRGLRRDVVSFDQLELADFLPFPVTVVSYDAEALGQQAAEMLFQRIAGETALEPREVIVPTRLTALGDLRM